MNSQLFCKQMKWIWVTLIQTRTYLFISINSQLFCKQIEWIWVTLIQTQSYLFIFINSQLFCKQMKWIWVTLIQTRSYLFISIISKTIINEVVWSHSYPIPISFIYIYPIISQGRDQTQFPKTGLFIAISKAVEGIHHFFVN